MPAARRRAWLRNVVISSGPLQASTTSGPAASTSMGVGPSMLEGPRTSTWTFQFAAGSYTYVSGGISATVSSSSWCSPAPGTSAYTQR